MKKIWISVFVLMLLACVPARADEPLDALREALPRDASELLDGSAGGDLSSGFGGIVSTLGKSARDLVRTQVRGAARVLLAALLCGVAASFSTGTEGVLPRRLTGMAGALTVTMLTAGSVESLIGLGAATIQRIQVFSKALLPTMAAATAASGAAGTAASQQVVTVFFVDVLVQAISGVLLPLVYLYIGALTAGAMLPESPLSAAARGVKTVCSWLLSGSVLLFTGYLSLARATAAAADRSALRLTKAAISGAVPVVGKILSDASEAVLSGAMVLRGTIGVFGTLGVLALCAYPFLQLGVQYLLYKGTAFLSATVAPPELCSLIDGLAGAFGLVLGMTGACALALVISVVSSMLAVTL